MSAKRTRLLKRVSTDDASQRRGRANARRIAMVLCANDPARDLELTRLFYCGRLGVNVELPQP